MTEPSTPIESSNLRELTRDPVDEARLQDNWRAIQRRRARPQKSARPLALAVGIAAAAALALFVLWPRDATPGPLALADGAAFESLAVGETELDDGSRITLFEDAQVSVLESSGQRVILHLESGRARFDITPGGPRRWIVEAGPARVEVVGTVFTVDRDGARVDVGVERGVVLVRAESLPDGVRRLTAGQHVTVAPRMVAAAPPSTATAEALAQAPTEVEDSASPSAEPAAEGRWGRGESSPPSTDPPMAEHQPARPVRRGPTAEALMARADEARLAGQHAEAASALRTLLERYPRDGRASMAAVTLGRLELRQRQRPAAAAQAFARALRMGLPPSLDESVRAQHVEALGRAGRTEAAQEAAAEYHRRYPNGRWTSELQRWAR